MIPALVCDFDGLIIDTESALIDAYAHVHRAHGVPFESGRFQSNVGHADYAFDPWYAFGPGADRDALESERQRRNRELGWVLPLLPGVAALLDAGTAAGLALAIVSNSGHPHVDAHLARLGLLERFACVACRGDAPSPKPEPDLYRFALGRLGLRGIEAIAFEDSPPGILAAKRAGLWAVAVPSASTAGGDFSAADLRVAALTDLGLPDLRARFGAAR